MLIPCSGEDININRKLSGRRGDRTVRTAAAAAAAAAAAVAGLINFTILWNSTSLALHALRAYVY